MRRPDHSGRRTIPTRVGRTQGTRRKNARVPDHPHAGGENETQTQRFSRYGGPSPRGWGELAGPRIAVWRSRTIPTRVGRTEAETIEQAKQADHPHAGGENQSAFEAKVIKDGPSPRGWGELRAPRASRGSRRTIPTRVGRT